MKIKIVSDNDEQLTSNNYLVRSIILNSLLVDIVVIGMVLFIDKNIYYYSSYIMQGIQTVLMLTCLFMIMYRKDGRGLHDKLAHTKVITCDEE